MVREPRTAAELEPWTTPAPPPRARHRAPHAARRRTRTAGHPRRDQDLGRLRRSVTDRHDRPASPAASPDTSTSTRSSCASPSWCAIFFGGAGLLALRRRAGSWCPRRAPTTSRSASTSAAARSRSPASACWRSCAAARRLGRGASGSRGRWRSSALVALWFLHRKQQRRRTGDSVVRTGVRRPARADRALRHRVRLRHHVRPRPRPCRPTPRAPGAYARPRRPRNPRKRGPILFWFTLALIALAEGVLGVVDLAGADVADSAYPALALGITAVMLLVGAFWGRAGGLILLGLVAAIATAGASLGSHVPEDAVTTPRPAPTRSRRTTTSAAGELHPRPVRRRGRRRPRRPRHLDRRRRRSARGRRPRRRGRRRADRGRGRRQPGLRPEHATASTSTSTGSSTAGTTSRT